MWNFINGKKTYIISILGILGTLGMWWGGQIDTQAALAAIWAALVAMGIRHGIDNA